MLTFESFVKKISDVLKKKIQKKFLDNRFNLTRKLYIRAFLFNSFMAEAPIIQKTVHWFAEQNMDLRYERVKPRLTWLVSLFNKTSEIAKSDISLQVILGRSLNTTLSTSKTNHVVHQVIDTMICDLPQTMFFEKMTFSVTFCWD